MIIAFKSQIFEYLTKISLVLGKIELFNTQGKKYLINCLKSFLLQKQIINQLLITYLFLVKK